MADSGSGRVFHIPMGLPFCESLISGLIERSKTDPQAIARTELFLSSGRMADGVKEALRRAKPTLWPKLRLISDLASDPTLTHDLPPARGTLERQLLLAQLIGKLSDQTGALASQSARFALAASLDAVLSEFQRADLGFNALADLDLSAFAEHWSLSKSFLSLIADFLAEDAPRDEAARQVLAIKRLAKRWQAKPPEHPVILAGSTGSREDTVLLMQAVATLPNGAVILPGFDQNLPPDIQQGLGEGDLPADHPQAALSAALAALDATRPKAWLDHTVPTDSRARLISLAMTPAPVTDRWLSEGPELIPALDEALKPVELIEAATPREEAMAIALRVRHALDADQNVVVITPDRTLARQVTAELKRWQIRPDDSAGRPLHQTPPGIFLRLIGKCLGRRAEAIDAIALLKHPLCLADPGLRGPHLLRLREIEARLLRGGPPHLNTDHVADWIAENEPDWAGWWAWIAAWFAKAGGIRATDLRALSDLHGQLATELSAGPNGIPDPEIWKQEAGAQALQTLETLKQASDAAGPLSLQDWSVLLRQALSSVSVRDTEASDPRVSIWGTLEARNTSRDLVILSGLNEGVWPALPKPNPWLNRPMRKSVGLQSPERAVGLSAHDFQMGVMAKNIVLTRALRDGDAPTVPSRWVLRLTNLLSGLGAPGTSALENLRQRGQIYLDWARQMDRPQAITAKAPRPAPVPPSNALPKKLPVTAIQNLIRDPYAIYARYVLGLRRLDPLGRVPDVLLRGTALHKVVEAFSKSDTPKDRMALLEIAADELRKHAPWPVSYHQWLARVERIADWLVEYETALSASETIASVETEGQLSFPELGFTLTAKPDRLNQGPDGLRIMDYKTSGLPTDAQIKSFDKQLPLTKLIAEGGGFTDLGPKPVTDLTYVSLKALARNVDWEAVGVPSIEADFKRLLAHYLGGAARFAARTRPTKIQYASDYDHLSRRGEWEDRDPAVEVSL